MLQVGAPAVAKPATNAKATPKRFSTRPALLDVAILAIFVVSAGSIHLFFSDRIRARVSMLTGRPATANLSIVVKAFVNLSGDSTQDYLADA